MINAKVRNIKRTRQNWRHPSSMLVENSLYIDIQSYSILRKVNERIFALVINKGMGFITTIVEVDGKYVVLH